jgi:hypothetical protein
VTNRNRESSVTSTVYAGATSFLNADSLAASLSPASPALMPKELLSLEAAELSVVASASLPEIAEILRQQEIDQLVHQSILGASSTSSTQTFRKAATSKADPRRQQDWLLRCLQGGRTHPLASPSCGVAVLCYSPPALEPEPHTRKPWLDPQFQVQK